MAGRSTVIVPRKAVELSRETRGMPKLLSCWRDAGAYVLLAEPGAGKTEAFRAEARETGGTYISARDFITLRPRTSNAGAPIFIDGLDEIRAGSGSHRGPLDDIRRRLDELGSPRFRLSCREADWRSTVDGESLRAVAPTGELAELHLQDLDRADILAVSRDLGVGCPEEILTESERHGVRPLLGNPLLLRLMVDTVGKHGGQWPASRSEIYRTACDRLAVEYNAEHSAERRHVQPSIDAILGDAGLIAALWLLADIAGFSDDASVDDDSVLRIDALPDALGIKDPRTVLSTKLFVADGDRRIPRHRTIAEFLAAGAIAARIENGLPVGRVLALMSGADGGIVNPLRGLNAWLVTRCTSQRQVLIDRDPLGVVLYGDLKVFSKNEKKQVLRALHREAQRFAWFRKGHWEAHPFGALGTADMADTFHDLLTVSDRSPAHESLLGCVLDAIAYGDPMPSLERDLKAIMRDPTVRADTRLAALDAWLAQPSPDLRSAHALLDETETGAIVDPDDQLAGRLLGRLYPGVVTPGGIAKYFRAPKIESYYGLYQDFWRRRLIALTPREDIGKLMDAWTRSPTYVDEDRWRFTRSHIAGELLAAALAQHSDEVPIETLHAWFGIGLDKHGVSRLTGDDVKVARDWLSARPAKQKALVAYGWSRIRIDGTTGRRYFWESEERILGATRPPDWYAWLLEQASATNDEELARYCFDDVARAAINPGPDFPLSMEAVEDWVRQNYDKWPQAKQWLQERWSVPLNHWEREESQRQNKYNAKRETDRRERRSNIVPHLASISAGTAPAGLMHQIAMAYEARYLDIHGGTPVERVRDFLGGTVEEAESAIEGLERTLARTDLPQIDEILKEDLAGRSHYIRPACLLGASRAWERAPDSCLGWPDDLVQKLAAFWLTEGVGEQSEWFTAVAAQRPALVAPVLERFAVQRLRRRSVTSVAGLWPLARDVRLAELARLVVPALLRVFPVRANDRQLQILNAELLPAAIRSLSSKELAAILEERTALKSLDAAQRIAYLVAGLGIDGEGFSRKLLRLIGTSESRAAHVGRALQWQGERQKGTAPLPVLVAGRLIELIAPHTSPERPAGVHSVGDAEHRRDWACHLINQLASVPSVDAAKEIARLAALPRLARWKPMLDSAGFDQSRAMRDATFRQAGVEDVANVLANKAPASSEDLAALILDEMRKIEARLRGDDTNGLRLFRRDDGRTPKSENECRDLLLGHLRGQLLDVGVNLEKEGQAVHDTRADLRAEVVRPGRRFVVPIEIKKEDNRELWSAWRTQLRSYTLDPASDGVGIYLVLWFGEKARASPDGQRPSTPQQLTGLLSGMASAEDRFKVHVAVLDLSYPSSVAIR